MEALTDIRAMNVEAGRHDTEKQHDISCDDGCIRTGDVQTATAHVITAVIGAGVLTLPWSVAQLGWLLGAPILLAFSWVTYYSAVLLTDCYRSPHPVTGARNYKYRDAAKANPDSRRSVQGCDSGSYDSLPPTRGDPGLQRQINGWLKAISRHKA